MVPLSPVFQTAPLCALAPTCTADRRAQRGDLRCWTWPQRWAALLAQEPQRHL